MIDITKLIESAINAQQKAICPYSNYPVGAALLKKYTNRDFEDVSDVIFSMGRLHKIKGFDVKGYDKFKMLAVVTRDGATPCGSCRQIIYEFAGNIPIIISDINKNYYESNTKDLLPNPFG